MRRILNWRRPSPALVVAVVALAMTATGTAVGLPGKDGADSKATTAKLTKKEKKKVRKIARNIAQEELGKLVIASPQLGAISEVTVSSGPTAVGGDSGNVVATCPTGTRVISGGPTTSGGIRWEVGNSHQSGNGWLVRGSNQTANPNATLRANANCLSP